MMTGTEANMEFNDNHQAEGIVSRNLRSLANSQPIQSNAQLRNSDASSLTEHNDHYTRLLKTYVDDFEHNAKIKREYKQKIFLIYKILLVGVPIATITLAFVTLLCLVTDKVDVLEALPGLITALATLVGTFMVIPKMITKYLFNKKEEDNLAKIIAKIQEYDRNIREKM